MHFAFEFYDFFDCDTDGASAVALEEGEGGGEEDSCGEGEQDNGVAIGLLSCRWGGGGVVEALGAALGAGWRGA
jgi:hypothetical protein